MSDELERATRAYAKRLKGVDASLDDRVMQGIGRPPGTPLQTRAPLRVVRSPRRWFVPLAAAAMLAVWFGGVQYGKRNVAQVAQAPASDTVYVRFELRQPDANAVHLAGDFSDWRADAIPLVKETDGTWSVTLPLSVGQHVYQFVIDGERWMPDPAAGAVDDGFGGRNSVIVVGPKGVVRS